MLANIQAMSLLGWRLCKLYEVGKMTPGQASLCKVWGLGVTSQSLAVTWIFYSWFVRLAWLYLSFRSKDYCLNFSFSGLWVWCINQQHTEGVTCVKLFGSAGLEHFTSKRDSGIGTGAFGWQWNFVRLSCCKGQSLASVLLSNHIRSVCLFKWDLIIVFEMKMQSQWCDLCISGMILCRSRTQIQNLKWWSPCRHFAIWSPSTHMREHMKLMYLLQDVKSLALQASNLLLLGKPRGF